MRFDVQYRLSATTKRAAVLYLLIRTHFAVPYAGIYVRHVRGVRENERRQALAAARAELQRGGKLWVLTVVLGRRARTRSTAALARRSTTRRIIPSASAELGVRTRLCTSRIGTSRQWGNRPGKPTGLGVTGRQTNCRISTRPQFFSRWMTCLAALGRGVGDRRSSRPARPDPASAPASRRPGGRA